MGFGHLVNSNLSGNCICLNCGFANVFDRKYTFLPTRENNVVFMKFCDQINER